MYGGKYYMGFVGHLLGFPAVKEFWKSVKNWRSCCHEFGVQFFWPTLYIPTVCWIYEGVHENIGVRWFVCDGSWNCHTAAIQRHAARYVNDGAIDHLVVSSRPTQRRSAAAVAALYGSSITRHAIRRILLYTKRCEMRNKIYRDLVEGPSGRIYDFMFSLNTHTQHSA